MKRAQPQPERDPVMRASSGVLRRTIVLYRERVPRDWPADRINEPVWLQASRDAWRETGLATWA